MSDRTVTGGKDEEQKKRRRRNLTIDLDNRMYLTHMFLGLIIANCDFRNAANQRKLGGHPRRGTKLEELQLLESLHDGKARRIVAHSRAGLESKVSPRFSLWMTCSRRENWTTHHDPSQNQGQLYSDSLCRIKPRIESRHTQEMSSWYGESNPLLFGVGSRKRGHSSARRMVN